MLITVVCTVVEGVLGFILAMLLVKDFRGRGLVMVYFLLPMMVVPAVSGFIFQMLFQVRTGRSTASCRSCGPAVTSSCSG